MPKTKLTIKEKTEIVQEYITNQQITIRSLAVKWGISDTHVSRIITTYFENGKIAPQKCC